MSLYFNVRLTTTYSKDVRILRRADERDERVEKEKDKEKEKYKHKEGESKRFQRENVKKIWASIFRVLLCTESSKEKDGSKE